MKEKKKSFCKKVTGIVFLFVAIIIICLLSWRKDAIIYATPALGGTSYENSYQVYLEKHGYQGILAESDVVIDINNFTASEEDIAYIGSEGVITEGYGSVSFTFNVEEAGFYNLELGYIALPGTTSDLQRKVYIDGELPYSAATQIAIKRFWQDESIRVKSKNEIRPKATEIYKETLWFMEDYNRRTGEPLLFYFDSGSHVITFEASKEPMLITSLQFTKYEQAAAYQEVIVDLLATYPEYKGEALIYQAERAIDNTTSIIKNSNIINIQKNYSDSNLMPYHPYRIVYNTIGGESWQSPGDTVTWEITTEEEGLYSINFKGCQNINRGITSYRRLYINDEIPYLEMNAIGFNYSTQMNNYKVTDETGQEYLFYLKKGTNTIMLETVLGPFGGVVSKVEESVSNLNRMYREIIKLCGQSPNKFIDYEIAKKIPEFITVMTEESERLFQIVEDVVAITGEKGEQTSILQKMAYQAQRLAAKPESVTEELGTLKNNISAVGTWLVNISKMPLELDSISLYSAGSELHEATAGQMASMYNGTIRFFSTFFNKVSQVSAEETDGGTDEIKVWMASNGREQAQIAQNIMDEMFSPETGINVTLQLIPEDVVLRAALAGNGPDVVIGLKQTTVQDFAMRDATVDLSELEGYEEIASVFYDSTLEAATYRNGVYALPEQANFMMMFLRNDILEELNISVPGTWSELKDTIPVLQSNNYNLFLPNALLGDSSSNINLYLSMVFQYGGDIYEGAGSDYGMASALNNDEAMRAFKDYTDFFTNYGLDVTVDFPNRFRTGEMPVGIANYNTFNTLEIFAPEIKGLWSFVPIPGIQKEDGSINRSYALDTVQAVIMSQSKNKDAAWQFLKWWVGTDAQLAYANSLESIMGTAARYSAANPEVLKQLPWSNSELNSLTEQFKATIGIHAVPGYYMNNRMIQNAFNSVKSDLSNPRETLYLNIKSINKELAKKREEFGIQ